MLTNNYFCWSVRCGALDIDTIGELGMSVPIAALALSPAAELELELRFR